ncbi:hypothetical protein TESG_06326 [Trichophyton tonsurans CBS 112818]|uniref:Uncharacterized protein n=1 Tax=Trichophyton tonsurans (strain CBS 112818) TaxID=647933 RepID=F2S5W4_TRIT1|nr:hypothetical protein TESG_06326 [Trichophyton tonsurans CBS 112818]
MDPISAHVIDVLKAGRRLWSISQDMTPVPRPILLLRCRHIDSPLLHLHPLKRLRALGAKTASENATYYVCPDFSLFFSIASYFYMAFMDDTSSWNSYGRFCLMSLRVRGVLNVCIPANNATVHEFSRVLVFAPAVLHNILHEHNVCTQPVFYIPQTFPRVLRNLECGKPCAS